MKIIGQLWRFFSPFKVRMALSVLLGFATVGAGVGLMFTSGYLIAKAALHPSTILLLWIPIVGVRFFGLSRAVFRYAERYVSHDLTFRTLTRLRVWLYEKLEPLAPAVLQNTRGGDVLSTLIGDVDTLQNLYLRVVAPALVAILTLALVYAMVAHFSSRIAAVLLGLLLFAGVVVPFLTNRFSHRDSEGVVQSRGQVYTDLLDAVEGMTEVVSFNQVEDIFSRLESRQALLSRQQTRLSQVGGIGAGLTAWSQNFAALAVLVLAIPLVHTGHVSGMTMTALVLTALASFEAVSPLSAAFQSLGQTTEAARRVFGLAAKLPVVHNPVWCEDSRRQITPTHYDLSVRGLRFRYHETTREVVRDVSFDLPFGKHLAIVGSSGSGKSTLVSLLLRLWEYEGSILFGGAELRAYDAEAVRELISVVPQQPYLFHTTFSENLRVAKPNATPSELEQAIALAQLSETISLLPEGCETLVGEQGAALSGGERQRMALARAFLQSSPLLILDEPTNGLDAVTEQKVMSAVMDAARTRSLIFITHRLVGLAEMDEILVMQEGRIAERGAHDVLLAQNGIYRAMWELESQIIG
ncbi:MAG: thiol reductant ABC exporter subunit CydC [Bacilli bacterium]